MLLEKGISRLLKVVGVEKNFYGHLSDPFLADIRGKRCLVATNAHALVVLPVDGADNDTLGTIPAESLKALDARKPSHPVEVKVNGSISYSIAGQSMEFERAERNMPEVEKVIPKPEESDIILGINPELLLNLAKAMEFNPKLGVVLRLKTNGHGHVVAAINVSAPGCPETIGVVMPMQVTT